MVSIILGIIIVTAWNQKIRNKTSTKMSSTGEVIEIREENTSINLTKSNLLLLLNKPIT